jgi:hypothetical protein
LPVDALQDKRKRLCRAAETLLLPLIDALDVFRREHKSTRFISFLGAFDIGARTASKNT